MPVTATRPGGWLAGRCDIEGQPGPSGLWLRNAGRARSPRGIGALLPRTLAGRLTDRIGPRPVVLAGMAIAAAGTVPFALAGAHTSELLLSGCWWSVAPG
jgi:hypothetical protein